MTGPALLFWLCPGPAMADDEGEATKSCSYYDPNPDCTEDERDRWRSSFGLPSLEEVHRNMGTDGDLILAMMRIKRGAGLAIAVRANRDGTASAELFRQRYAKSGSSERLPVRVRIPKQEWAEIVAEGKALPDVFAREEVYVCGATFMIEFRDRQGNVRAPVGDSCGGEPREVYF